MLLEISWQSFVFVDMALEGKFALLEYNVGGPQVIHKRWVVSHVTDEEYAVVTPDEDIYTEQLSIVNDDLRSIVGLDPGLVGCPWASWLPTCTPCLPGMQLTKHDSKQQRRRPLLRR